MFVYLYQHSNSIHRYILFFIFPIILLINLWANLFIGGFLIVAMLMAAIVFDQMTSIAYYVISLTMFITSVLLNKSVNPKAIITQGLVYVITLTVAYIAGTEIKAFLGRIEDKRKENCHLTTELIHSFITAIDAKDHYLHNHSYNVAHYTRKIAIQMDFSPLDVEEVSLAALFHDIGKLTVSEEILNKPEPLSESEWKVMRKHPSSGVDMLKNIKQLDHIIHYAKYHHRRYDGTGYPNDCPMDKIPLQSHIIALADAFDAMTSDRPYRKALSVETAYKELLNYRGSQFHPDVVDAFLEAELLPVRIEVMDIDLLAILDH